MTDELELWTPEKFSGSDLLPTVAPKQELVDGIPIVGRESVEEVEVFLPWLKLLQGMSPETQEGIPGAKPGKFFLSSTQEVIEPPIRVLALMHNNSASLFPKDKPNFYDEEGKPYERCMSRDGVEANPGNRGTTFCDECGLSGRDAWTVNPNTGKKVAPPCEAAHNFTVLLPSGPAKIRFKGWSYRPATDFIRTWKGSPKNLWHHPLEIRVKEKDNPEYNSTTYYMELWWTVGEMVPKEYQQKAYETFVFLNEANDTGRLKEEDSTEG